jgi:hypothetical protein
MRRLITAANGRRGVSTRSCRLGTITLRPTITPDGPDADFVLQSSQFTDQVPDQRDHEWVYPVMVPVELDAAQFVERGVVKDGLGNGICPVLAEQAEETIMSEQLRLHAGQMGGGRKGVNRHEVVAGGWGDVIYHRRVFV